MPLSFVELLDRNAPPEAFEERVRLARENGVSGPDLQQLRAELAAALRVRSTMARHEQREVELGALYRTATDLTAIRDVDAVLAAIVRRARSLLGVDLAYLSLFDDQRHDVYIRITDGSVSARFRDIRLPLGTGLGGLMVQTTTPYATGDYQHDSRFVHDPSVDAAVADEGIHALLGVPLLLDGDVIGGLLAGNRTPRPFLPDEVALATSLAAHAVVALENARLFEQTQRAIAELDSANATVRRHAESVELAADAHDRLARVLLEGGEAGDVVDALREVLGGSVAVLTPEGGSLAASPPGRFPVPDRDLRAAVAEACTTGRTAEIAATGGARYWLTAAVAGSEHLGTLLLTDRDALSGPQRRILERAAVVTALLLLFQRSLAEAEDRVRGDLLTDLLTDPERNPATLRQRARRHHADLDVPHAVVAARTKDTDRPRAMSAAARIAASRGGLAALYHGDIVVALPDVRPEQAARLLADRLQGVLGYRVTAGASGPAAGPVALRDHHRRARSCLEALLALGRQGQSADSSQLGLATLLLGGHQTTGSVDGFVAAQLGPLLDHDARRGSRLLDTVEAYFDAGGNLGQTGTALHLHINTVSQRLGRITTLLGAGWKQPQRALEIQLALQLRRLRHVMPPAAGSPDTPGRLPLRRRA